MTTKQGRRAGRREHKNKELTKDVSLARTIALREALCDALAASDDLIGTLKRARRNRGEAHSLLAAMRRVERLDLSLPVHIQR